MEGPIDNATLWELHLMLARCARDRGDVVTANRAMRSARTHAAARRLIKRLA